MMIAISVVENVILLGPLRFERFPWLACCWIVLDEAFNVSFWYAIYVDSVPESSQNEQQICRVMSCLSAEEC